jgi:hypothetical protein
LSRARDAMKAAAVGIGREELLRDRSRQGLCANGRTKLAQQDAMRVYMMKYRARKRAERLAEVQVRRSAGAADAVGGN